jgi:hypothetical protein
VTPSRARRSIWSSVVLLIVGVGAIAFGLVQSEALGWASPGWRSRSRAGSRCWPRSSRGRAARAPAIDLSLFQDRTYRYINLASLCFAIGFAMMFFQTFLFTTGVWSYSLTRAGLAGTPGPLLVVPTAIVCSRFAARAGTGFAGDGSLISMAASLWFALVPGVTPDYLHAWLPGALLTGLGVGMVMPSLSAAAVAHLPPARFGVGSAVNQAIRQMGSVFGVALTVAITGNAITRLAEFHALLPADRARAGDGDPVRAGGYATARARLRGGALRAAPCSARRRA